MEAAMIFNPEILNEKIAEAFNAAANQIAADKLRQIAFHYQSGYYKDRKINKPVARELYAIAQALDGKDAT
jgi:hypothetical protein